MGTAKLPKRLQITHDDPDPELVEAAVRVLREGGVIVYPTETLYGLGADALREPAVRRVFEIKGRPARQPIPIIIAEEGMLDRVAASVPDVARELAAVFWPGPLTLVLRARPELPRVLLGGGDTVGVRVSGSRLCRELSRLLDGPITATSANVSGGSDLRTAEEVAKVLGDKVDLILDAGPARTDRPSTIVDCTGRVPRVLREGAIPTEKLKRRIPDLGWS